MAQPTQFQRLMDLEGSLSLRQDRIIMKNLDKSRNFENTSINGNGLFLVRQVTRPPLRQGNAIPTMRGSLWTNITAGCKRMQTPDTVSLSYVVKLGEIK